MKVDGTNVKELVFNAQSLDYNDAYIRVLTEEIEPVR